MTQSDADRKRRRRRALWLRAALHRKLATQRDLAAPLSDDNAQQQADQ